MNPIMAAVKAAACVGKQKGALCWLISLSSINRHLTLYAFYVLSEARLFGGLIFCSHSREGRSNAHIKGDSQRIGDVMLKNIQALRVRNRSAVRQ